MRGTAGGSTGTGLTAHAGAGRARRVQAASIKPRNSMFNAGGVPNGIRTRVLALKGLDPRPLDDGDRKNVATSICVGRLPFPGRFEKRVDRPRGAVDPIKLEVLGPQLCQSEVFHVRPRIQSLFK